ncbi:peptidyl-prolyl cis-trans isomerase PIN4 [Xylariaceae sp. FL0594]|nr:peptidyl-prolyl cis-trans isomerase PIN4 [Xylariaceae sp. FL0594]
MAPKKKTDSKAKGSGAGEGGTQGGKKGAAGKLKGGQAITARHILCQKHSKMEEALAALNKLAGDGLPKLKQFDEVARQYSEDKANVGGFLGPKKVKGSFLPAFEEVAYSLTPADSSTSDGRADTNLPVQTGVAKTSEGYHIIAVERRH